MLARSNALRTPDDPLVGSRGLYCDVRFLLDELAAMLARRTFGSGARGLYGDVRFSLYRLAAMLARQTTL
jgi:hypothetical protein